MPRVTIWLFGLMCLLSMAGAQTLPYKREFRVEGSYSLRGTPFTVTSFQVELLDTGKAAVRLKTTRGGDQLIFGRWIAGGSMSLVFTGEDAGFELPELFRVTMRRESIRDDYSELSIFATGMSTPAKLRLSDGRTMERGIMSALTRTNNHAGTGKFISDRREVDVTNINVDFLRNGRITLRLGSNIVLMGYQIDVASNERVNLMLTSWNGRPVRVGGSLTFREGREIAEIRVEGSSREGALRLDWRNTARPGTSTTSPELFVSRGSGRYKIDYDRQDLPDLTNATFDQVTFSRLPSGDGVVTLSRGTTVVAELSVRLFVEREGLIGFEIYKLGRTTVNPFGGGLIEMEGRDVRRIRFYGRRDGQQYTLTFDR